MKHKYLKNVVTLRLIEDKCVGCGMCLNVCPHGVFQLKEGKSQILDKDFCMECGACARNCASGAITVASGVGCASAILTGMIKGTEPQCGSDCCSN